MNYFSTHITSLTLFICYQFGVFDSCMYLINTKKCDKTKE